MDQWRVIKELAMSDINGKDLEIFKEEVSIAMNKFMKSKEYTENTNQSRANVMGLYLSYYFSLIVIHNGGTEGFKELANKVFQYALSEIDENDPKIILTCIKK